MRGEHIVLNKKELNRITVLQQLIDGLFTTREAAQILGLSDRQVKRLKKGFVENGPAALAHGNRNRPPVHKMPDSVREEIIELATSRYAGFNYHHLKDMLERHHDICVSVSSVRRLLVSNGFPTSKKRRPAKKSLSRPRRARFGELVQIDGSPHHWIGPDHPSFSLLIAIDDATGSILAGVFRPTEDFFGYAMLMHQLISHYGKPLCVYSDRHSIFKSPKSEKLSIEDQLKGITVPLTHFGLCLENLDIVHTCARSPQAKGRVERAFETLQDRLVKEMILSGVSSIEEANAFLVDHISQHNRSFAVSPASDVSAFRPAPSKRDLLRALAWREQRSADSGSSISLKGQKYILIDSKGRPIRLGKGSKVTVLLDLNGDIYAVYNDKTFTLKPASAVTIDCCREPSVKIQNTSKTKSSSIPAPNHPWRKWNPDFCKSKLYSNS